MFDGPHVTASKEISHLVVRHVAVRPPVGDALREGGAVDVDQGQVFVVVSREVTEREDDKLLMTFRCQSCFCKLIISSVYFSNGPYRVRTSIRVVVQLMNV